VLASLDVRLRAASTLRERLAARPTVTALCHENPDADTVGAAVAMALAARQLGCAVEVVAAVPLPPALNGLTDGLMVNSRPTQKPGLAVVCDAPTLARIGPAAQACREWLEEADIVNIDHHVTNVGFGSINLVDPDAAATCQIVSWLLPQIGVRMDGHMASAILAGVLRDSHGFSTPTTSADTLRAAADAVDAGAPLEAMYRSTMLDLAPEALDLWGRVLIDLRREEGGRITWAVISQAMLAAAAAAQHDAEGIAELIARARGVEIALLLRDLDGHTRVSIRTTAGIDAAAIAALFGGGGHDQRAGCTIAGRPDVAIGQLLAACRERLGR
jgi:phosphoesterase RecJ-like protein